MGRGGKSTVIQHVDADDDMAPKSFAEAREAGHPSPNRDGLLDDAYRLSSWRLPNPFQTCGSISKVTL
jgi:hypothetical protein